MRLLVLAALALASASALTPFSASPAKEGCALLLDSAVGGKSSAFDRARNVFYGADQYDGAGTCITYSAVNEALQQALNYLRIDVPEREWRAEELSTVGEVFLEVSKILAVSYGLSAYDVEYKLPLLDTYHTDLLRVCPDYLSPLQCVPGRYRRFDGLCNNLIHPTWGARLTTFPRLIAPAYHDGIDAPRQGYDGLPLPSARLVTQRVHFEENFNEHAATTMVVSFGQFMDHDFTLTGTILDPLNRNEFEECCRPRNGVPNKYCNNIDIAADDPFFSRFGVRCLDFVRGFPGVRHGCRLGSRAQFNLLTSTIDANTVYGVRESFAKSLRAGYGGLLRMNPYFKSYGLRELLPLKTDIPDEGCTRLNKNQLCFDAGEIRVNEQLILTVQHTLWARQHNLIAAQLGQINPHWDDERLYQEARHIVIAMIQHVTYNEFLAVVLGKDMLAKFNLLLPKVGYWNGYDATVNPGILASFSAAAFRFGHTLLPTNVERWSKLHRYITHTPLSDLIRKPFDLFRPGVFDEYVLGLTNQPALAFDDFVTNEVTTLLFKKVGEEHGVDLTALNLQRNREFGLPGYTTFRKFCGHSPVETWEDLLGSMSNETVYRYASVLRSPHDIDLWSGGVAERALPGSLLGPTFACIIATQFSNVRAGDRFWYENGGQPSSFTPQQLQEIRKTRLARVLCENTDLIETVQLYPFVLPDHEINPRVSCKNSIIPYMDLSKWAELPATPPKLPTLVQPLAYDQAGYSDPSDKNGVTLNIHALTAFRQALAGGAYAGAFAGPHRAPLYPQVGLVKPTPTRRPLVLSQEYIDTLDTKLTQAGLPNLSGLYNLLSVDVSTSNAIFKRDAGGDEFFGAFDPFAPKKAAEYRNGLVEQSDVMHHGPMKLDEHFTRSKFRPIAGPYGNFTSLEDFVGLAERMLTSSSSFSSASNDNSQQSVQQRPPGVPSPARAAAAAAAVPSKNAPAKNRNRSAPSTKKPRRFGRSAVGSPRRRRTASEPAPEKVSDVADVSGQVAAALQAAEAMQESYRLLYEEIGKARQLFAVDDAVGRSLDQIMADAATPPVFEAPSAPASASAPVNLTAGKSHSAS